MSTIQRINCKLCSKSFGQEKKFRQHLCDDHNLDVSTDESYEQLYVEHELSGVAKLCKCGCGQHTKFNSWKKGFESDFVIGHNARLSRKEQEEIKQDRKKQTCFVATNKRLENDKNIALMPYEWYSLKSFCGLKQFSCGIYCIRNIVNDKCYVGLTHGNICSRIKGHIYAALCSQKDNFAIHAAIRKHGIENFYVAVIETVEAVDLNKKEIEYISFFNTVKNGYNLTIGGEGTTGHTKTFEQCEKISKKRKGVPCPETVKCSLRKPVQQIDLATNEIIKVFPSVTDALATTKITNIAMCCKGKLKSAGGFVWKFLNEEHKNTVKWSEEKKLKMKDRWKQKYDKMYKKVAQINIDTDEVVEVFSSVGQAYKATKITNIDACARGLRASAGGFLWKYINDDDLSDYSQVIDVV